MNSKINDKSPSVNKSTYLVFILACLVAFGPLSIDMYLPSLPDIANNLKASSSSIKQTITVFLIGFSIGMLIYGPLSDRYGRRRLLLGGVILYLVATIICIMAKSAEMLLFARLLQALGGASASVLARAIVRDVYELRDAAKILSWMQIITMVATLIAPILGSFLVIYFGWRSIFLFLFVFALICLYMFTKSVPETLPSSSRLKSTESVVLSYYRIVSSKVAISYILCMGMAFAGMFVYITASPFVFIEFFGLSTQQYAYLFGSNIFGIMIMTIINANLVTRVGPQKMIQFCSLILLLSAISLFVMGVTGIGGLWGVIIGLWFFVAMTGTLNANCIAKLMGLFPSEAGAAAGLAISLQFGLGALLSFIVGLFSTHQPWPMVTLIAIAAIISFLSMLITRKNSLESNLH